MPTPPKPLTGWQQRNTPACLPRHLRRNIGPGEIIIGQTCCWLWLRSCSPDGYGWASLENKTHQAHRLIYTLVRGKPPAGRILDHLCRIRHCVNPEHMEPVTPRENLLRGNTPTGWDCCQRCGHSFIEVGNQRRCPRCLAEYRARTRAASRAAA